MEMSFGYQFSVYSFQSPKLFLNLIVKLSKSLFVHKSKSHIIKLSVNKFLNH